MLEQRGEFLGEIGILADHRHGLDWGELFSALRGKDALGLPTVIEGQRIEFRLGHRSRLDQIEDTGGNAGIRDRSLLDPGPHEQGEDGFSRWQGFFNHPEQLGHGGEGALACGCLQLEAWDARGARDRQGFGISERSGARVGGLAFCHSEKTRRTRSRASLTHKTRAPRCRNAMRTGGAWRWKVGSPPRCGRFFKGENSGGVRVAGVLIFSPEVRGNRVFLLEPLREGFQIRPCGARSDFLRNFREAFMQCHRGRGAFPIEGCERRAGTPSRFQNDCAARLGRAAGMWRNRSDRRAARGGFRWRFHPENHPPFHNRAGKPFEAVYVFFVPMLSSRKREPSILRYCAAKET